MYVSTSLTGLSIRINVRINRLLNLLSHLFKSLSFADFIVTIKSALFRNEMIYVYAVDIKNSTRSVAEPIFYEGKSDSVVIIKKGEIKELDEFRNKANESAWEFNCHRFDGVKDFFIAADASTIRHIAWLYKRQDPNRFVILGEKDALLQYGLTLPQFRGQGLAPAVQHEVMRYLREQGFKRMFSLVKSDNKASIKSLEKGGFSKVGQIRFIKIFGIQVSKKLDVSELNHINMQPTIR